MTKTYQKLLTFLLIGILVILAFAAMQITALAVPAYPFPVQAQQADGSAITVQLRGDEWFSWTEDQNGYVIAFDHESMNWRYAGIDGGNIVPSGGVVGARARSTADEGRITPEALVPLFEQVERFEHGARDGITPFGVQMATDQQLLLLLIEFDNQLLVGSEQYHHNRFFSTAPGAVSVANYWRDMSRGHDIFVPVNTSAVAGSSSFVNIPVEYTHQGVQWALDGVNVTVYPSDNQGVVRVRLHRDHPVPFWGGRFSQDQVAAAISVSLRAIHNNNPGFFDGIPHNDLHIYGILAGGEASGSRWWGQNVVWAHHWPTGFPGGINGRVIGGRAGWLGHSTNGEMLDAANVRGIGVAVHELGHSLGLPDLYDISNVLLPQFGFSGNTAGLGVFCLMAGGSWGARAGEPPGSLPVGLSAWSKARLGFVQPTNITAGESWLGNLYSLAYNPENFRILRINHPASPQQYFLVENRQGTSGWDRGWESHGINANNDNNGGILIYHVDNSMYPVRNSNYRRRLVDLEEADGSNFLNSGRWPIYSAHDAFFRYGANNVFGPNTTPNSNFYESRTVGFGLELGVQDVETGIIVTAQSPRGDAMLVLVGDASGLNPRVDSWEELREAINAAPANEPVTIEIASSFAAPAGPSSTIIIPEDRKITLVSTEAAPGDANVRTLTQMQGWHSGWLRHFSVNGSLTLGQNITLSGAASNVHRSGGVQINAGGIFTMKDGSVIENCFAPHGGAVMVGRGGAADPNCATFNMNGGTIRNNTAQQQGGGVAVSANGRMNVTGGLITNNTSTGNGGGLWAGAGLIANGRGLHMTGGSITNNTAVRDGGGIQSTIGSGLLVVPETTYRDIYIGEDVIFYGNTAGSGASLPPVNRLPHIATTSSSIWDYALNNYDINYNALLGSTPDSIDSWKMLQRAVYLAPANVPVTLEISSSFGSLDMTGNDIVIPADRQITLVSTNTAPGDDNMRILSRVQGNWMASDHLHFVVNGSLTIGQNITLSGGAEGNVNRRGGVRVNAGGTFTMDEGSVIENCNLGTTRSAVMLNSNSVGESTRATFNMNGGTIRNNTGRDGGAVRLGSNSRMYMSGGLITGNAASGSGGGVSVGVGIFSVVTGTGFHMTGGSITNNTATGDGGGIISWQASNNINLPADAYNDLYIGENAIFYGNTSGRGASAPPDNRLPHIATTSASIWDSPLNNYDINFTGRLGQTPNPAAQSITSPDMEPEASATPNEQSIALYVNDTKALTATALPNSATDETVTWSSSNDSVAMVNQAGVATGVSVGTATITATAANGLEASWVVRVIALTLEAPTTSEEIDATHSLDEDQAEAYVLNFAP